MFGIPNDVKERLAEECRDFLKRNVRRSKVFQHREENPEEVSAVEALIAPTLREWGYDLTAPPTGLR